MDSIAAYTFLLILLIEVIIFVKIDYSIFKKIITPFNILSVPYLTIVLIVCFFGDLFFLIPLHLPSLIIWEVGLLFFWIGGHIAIFPIISKKKLSKDISDIIVIDGEKYSEKISRILLFIIIPILVLNLLNFISIGDRGIQIFSDENAVKSLGNGVAAHLRILSYPLIVLLIGTCSIKKIVSIMLVLIMYLFILSYQVKAWAIIPLLAGILYRIFSGRTKVSFFKFFCWLTIVFLIFSIVYIFNFYSANINSLYNINTYIFIFNHFVNYVTAGVIGLSEYYQSDISFADTDWTKIFSVPLNIYSYYFQQQLIDTINNNFLQITTNGDRTSNVYTLFGTLYIHLGLLGMILYSICMGAVMYGLFTLSYIKRHAWIIVAWCFMAIFLFLGWFDYYFWTVSTIEVPVIIFLLYLYSELFSKKRPMVDMTGK